MTESSNDKRPIASERPPYPPQAPSPSTLPDPYLWFTRAVAPSLVGNDLDHQRVPECNTQPTGGSAASSPSSFFDAAELPFVNNGAKFSIKRPTSPYVDTFRPFSPEESECTTVYYSANSSFRSASITDSPVPSLRSQSFLDLSSRSPTPDSSYQSPIHRKCWRPLSPEKERLYINFPYSIADVAQEVKGQASPGPVPQAESYMSPIPSLFDDDASSNTSSADWFDSPAPTSSPELASPLIGDRKDVEPVKANPKPPMTYYTDPLGATAHFSYETAAFYAEYHEEMQRQRAINYEMTHGLPYVHWSIEADQLPLFSYLKRAMGYMNDPAWAHVQ